MHNLDLQNPLDIIHLFQYVMTLSGLGIISLVALYSILFVSKRIKKLNRSSEVIFLNYLSLNIKFQYKYSTK